MSVISILTKGNVCDLDLDEEIFCDLSLNEGMFATKGLDLDKKNVCNQRILILTKEMSTATILILTKEMSATKGS